MGDPICVSTGTYASERVICRCGFDCPSANNHVRHRAEVFAHQVAALSKQEHHAQVEALICLDLDHRIAKFGNTVILS